MTANELVSWVFKATPGDWVVYGTGSTLYDFSDPELRSESMRLATQGLIHLTQRRTMKGVGALLGTFDYIATRAKP